MRSGFGEGDGDGVLVIELEGDGGGLALVPYGLSDGVVEQDHSFGLASGLNGGLAQQGRGGERHERGEGDVEVGEVPLLEGAGGGHGAVGRSDGTGDVVEGERDAEAVVDADGCEDVIVVLEGGLLADDLGVGLEDSVRGQDVDVSDTDVGDAVRDVEIDEADDDGEDDESDDRGKQEVAAFVLGKGKFGHGGKDTAKNDCWSLVFLGRLARPAVSRIQAD